jgi:O-antigen/teichoic acid export membrane protein
MRPAKTSIVVFASSQVATLVGFVATFYIASYMGAGILGAYSVAVGLLYWVYLPSSAIDSAVTKRLSEGKNQGKILSAGAITNFLNALLVIIGIIAFSKAVESYVGHPVGFEIAALVGASFTAKFMSGVLTGQKKVASASIVWTSGRVVRTVFQIGLTFVFGLGVSGLIWGHTVSFITATVFALMVNSVRPAIPAKKHFRRLIEYAQYSWLGQLRSQAFNWLDTVVLALFVSATQIGIYEAAWTMASMLAIVSSAIGTTLFPNFSELSTQNRYDEISDLLRQGLIFGGLFTIPGLFGALTVGSRVLEIYGPEYGIGGLILVLLVVARLTQGYNSLLKNTINAIDRPEIGFRINAVALVSNVVLNFTLIPIFGWYGAAVGTGASATLTLIIGYHWVGRFIIINVPYLEIAYQIAASLAMTLVVITISQIIGPGRIGTVIIVFVAATVYTVILLFISQTIREKTVSILSDYL